MAGAEAGKWENGNFVGTEDELNKTLASVTWLTPQYYTTSSSKTI